jgi:hypothetical protein
MVKHDTSIQAKLIGIDGSTTKQANNRIRKQNTALGGTQPPRGKTPTPKGYYLDTRTPKHTHTHSLFCTNNYYYCYHTGASKWS